MSGSGAPGPIILWSAGEASGDRHAAHVMREIHARRPEVRAIGLGGPEMVKAGIELVAGMEEVAVVGLVEVLARWRDLLRVRRRLIGRLSGRPHGEHPALFIPVDYPGLNLLLARRAHALGVPVVYFVSPQLWAWGMGRLDTIRRTVRRMLVFFDFEVDLYRNAGVPVTLIGHPLIEQVVTVPERAVARRSFGLEDGDLALVLMPGSRAGEVRTHLPRLLAVVRALRRDFPALRVFLRVAPGLDPELLTATVTRSQVPVEIVADGDAAVVRAADLALVAAGTATLETALLETPMLIVYRVTRLTYWIARRLVRISSIGLVNVVAGRTIAPEFVQDAFSTPAVAAAASRLLGDPAAREAQRAELRALRPRLGGPGAAERAAEAILAELDRAASERPDGAARRGEPRAVGHEEPHPAS